VTTISTREAGIAQRSTPFLEWLDGWYAALPSVSLREDVIARAGGPGNVAVVVVDLLVGFCSEGPLSSPRVGALGPRAARFLTAAREAEVRHVLLATDAHPEDSREFAAFPPHCIRGTREAEVIPELTALPFISEAFTIPKGSLNVGHERPLGEWQARHPEVRCWIIIGDCTDLCVYVTAMHFRTQANARGWDVDVWVPADLVDTYDLPVGVAENVGALPHDGDLLHRMFLYHMALNGISVVRTIAP
jgi:nicotinamidase-related amidase